MRDEGIFLDANICLEVISIYYIFVRFFSKDNGVSLFLYCLSSDLLASIFTKNNKRLRTRTQKQEVWLAFKAINHFPCSAFFTFTYTQSTKHPFTITKWRAYFHPFAHLQYSNIFDLKFIITDLLDPLGLCSFFGKVSYRKEENIVAKFNFQGFY